MSGNLVTNEKKLYEFDKSYIIAPTINSNIVSIACLFQLKSVVDGIILTTDNLKVSISRDSVKVLDHTENIITSQKDIRENTQIHLPLKKVPC